MNNYDFIKKIDPDLYLSCIRRGIIPSNIMTWVTIYECYINELQQNKATISATFTADKYSISESTVWRIIAFMKS